MSLELHIPRRCREERRERQADQEHEEPASLAAFRQSHAYVLLGEPGAGKSTSFTEEARQAGCMLVRARELLRRDNLDAWKGKTLFIDGLDEMRAGGGGRGLPIDAISRQLERLGNPAFRLSCREADWLGTADREALGSWTGGGLIVLHLDPLDGDEIRRLASAWLEKPADEFLEHVHNTGFSELLGNPQNLKLLVEAFKGNVWPKSRKECFELACSRMAAEQDAKHQLALGEKLPPVEALLDAAGFICVMLLLTDKSGIASIPAESDESHPPLSEILPPDPLPLDLALRSRLFEEDGELRRRPAHRSVAEFLAARYLAGRIRDGKLSRRRVLALLAADDGKPVTGLRGLWAWLAALLDGTTRREMIISDPVAVMLYGDVRAMAPEDKRALLDALGEAARRYPWVLGGHWRRAPMGALATVDMAETLRNILNDSSREEHDQAVADCVVQALRHGDPIPVLAGTLETVVRDDSRWRKIRIAALEAWLRALQLEDGSGSTFGMALLDDARTGAVTDPDDELAGLLLEALYPRLLPPDTVFEYLHAPKQENFIGSYRMFWSEDFLKRTPDEALPMLLDQMAARPELRLPVDYWHPLSELIPDLLLKGLQTHGETVTGERLHDWLGIGLDEHGSQMEDGRKKITAWLSAHPQACKQVLSISLDRAAQKETFYIFEWTRRLYDAAVPPDWGRWLLSQAERTERDDIAREIFQQAVATLWRGAGNDGMSLDMLIDWCERRPRFRPWLDAMLVWELREDHWDDVRFGLERKEKRRRNLREWLAYFRSHQAALRAGGGPPNALDALASAYLGYWTDTRGDTPRERLAVLLDKDANLMADALTGLRLAPRRPDLPDAAEVFRLATANQRHLLAFPCLVSAMEAPEEIQLLPDETLKTLVAMYFTHGYDKPAPWLTNLKHTRPALVTEVLIGHVLPALKGGVAQPAGIHDLRNEEESKEIASQALPRLLEGFPLRAKQEQFHSLEILLKAGMRHLPETDFLKLTDARLGKKSLEDAQRTLWLAAGFLIQPGRYQESLAAHVGRNQTRIALLSGFLPDRGERWPFARPLPVTALAWLIGLIGAHTAPYGIKNGTYHVTDAMSRADLIESLIGLLGARPELEAGIALEELSSQARLAPWRNSLRHAAHSQETVRREAGFRHPAIGEILDALRGGAPAGPGDLAALTLEHLDELVKHVRDGASNTYRFFWDSHPDKTRTSKIENECRNILKDLLEPRLLSHRAYIDKEADFVDDKRSDLGVRFNGWRLPIEIKKDSYREKGRDVWNALRLQLIDQYLRGPDTGGYGIYVVFWFGEKKAMPSSPAGRKPGNAADLEAQLTELLEPAERHRVSVRVIDCAWPQ
ncbi:hypothetical protein [Sulfuritalea sp.]|uniref:hypothetical protein n=1 Tax=Sulfuritalea sp. TaxID=2480090 RepID=UPI001AC02E02|nr:hypothetical protein [Sulfuritalea sp.]MBN8476636.1 hypothetical protein [Sulfuritalea sp.]